MNDATKLLENGWRILIFKDGLGSYSALATQHASVDAAVREWQEHEVGEDVPMSEWPFDGPDRFVGCGFTVEDAMSAVAVKVLFKRVP